MWFERVVFWVSARATILGMISMSSLKEASRVRGRVAAVGVAVALMGSLVLVVPSAAQSAAPGRPANLSAELDGLSVTLSWDAPAGSEVAGYQILRRRPKQGEKIHVHVADTGTTATTWSESGLDDGVLHIYRVKAIGAQGDVGRWSLQVKVTPEAPPQAEEQAPDEATAPQQQAQSTITYQAVNPTYQAINPAQQDENPAENTATLVPPAAEPPPATAAATSEETVGTVSGVGVYTHPNQANVLIYWKRPSDTSGISGYAVRYRRLTAATSDAAADKTWSDWTIVDASLVGSGSHYTHALTRDRFKDASGEGDATYEFQIGSVPTGDSVTQTNYVWSSGVEHYIVKDRTKQTPTSCWSGDGERLDGWHCRAEWYILSRRQLPSNLQMGVKIGTGGKSMPSRQEPAHGPYHKLWCTHWVHPDEASTLPLCRADLPPLYDKNGNPL